MLRGGTSRVEITPKAGTHLGGTWGRLRKAETVLEPLHARAVVFASADKSLCFVSADVVIATRAWSDRIRKGIKEKTGIPEDAIMVHAPQPHSAPVLGNFIIDDEFDGIPEEHEYLRGSQRSYNEYAAGRIIEAAAGAYESLRPASIGCGRAVRDDLAFNRRAVMRDGTVRMPPFSFSSRDLPLGPTDICYMEGPMDPEVGVFCARDEDLNPVALLLHHTCHPVNVFGLLKGGNVVSPDWVGIWAQAHEGRRNGEMTAIVLNGCCGNINPWPPFRADYIPDHRYMGTELADTADKTLMRMTFDQTDRVDFLSRRIELPLRLPSKEASEEAARLLDQHPTVLWSEEDPTRADNEWMLAAMLRSVELEAARGSSYSYEIQAFRIGDVAFIGLPGEPMVEGQLEIKVGSPAEFTFVAHGVGDYAGYLAPESSYKRGGHEIRKEPAKWCKLGPGCLEAVARESVSMLKELFR